MMQHLEKRFQNLTIPLLLTPTLAIATGLLSPPGMAQITPDTSLPTPSEVTVEGTVSTIRKGTLAGKNLFHSFSQFSVPTNGTAYFDNASDIQNIFSRVTGNSRSNIDGLIKANGTANLFFLNPKGIVFGRNSSLNIGGSFLATTASAIQFGNQGSFSASAPNNPELLTINPSALLFNQIAAEPIKNQSQTSINKESVGLQVNKGQNLLLVGGNISMNGGRLTARGGRVELAGVAGAGSIELNQAGEEWQLALPDDLARADVSLSGTARILVTGADGGSITINARSLHISSERRSILRAGIAAGLGTKDSKAGDITLNATQNIEIVDSLVENRVNANSIGNSGKIVINAGSLSLTNGGRLSASTYGNGNAGDIAIYANTITVDGRMSAISSGVDARASGHGGEIRIGEISTPVNKLVVTNDAQIRTNTDGVGNGGGITIYANIINMSRGAINSNIDNQGSTGKEIIHAGKIHIHSNKLVAENRAIIESRVGRNENLKAKGNSGSIQIFTESLSVMNDSRLRVDSYAQGDAGNITINAREILLDGNNQSDGNHRTISSTVFEKAHASDKIRKIHITADTLDMRNTAQILADNEGAGVPGNVVIKARKVSLDGSIPNPAKLQDGSIPEQGKDESILVQDAKGGRHATAIFSRVMKNGTGKGGTIDINSEELSITRGAGIFATNEGNNSPEEPGTIKIVSDRVTLSGIGTGGATSGIFGNLDQGGKGSGAAITIQANSLLLTDGAQLISRTTGTGKAGNITVSSRNPAEISNQVEISNGASISVSSLNAGNTGNIVLEARSLILNNQALIEGKTNRGQQGGNISLKLRDLLLLGRNSNISTSAGEDQIGVGSGGNITITAPLIVAGGNSDIAANAFSGSGGKVVINASGTLGIVSRSRADLERLLKTTNPKDLDPQKLPTNDVTAISQSDPSLSGTVTFNAPDVDPSRGLVALPTTIVDAAQLITQRCSANQTSSDISQFVITGRGGLPPAPGEPFKSSSVLSPWVTLPANSARHPSPNPSLPHTTASAQIVEAQGWVKDGNGAVSLIAQVPATNAMHGSEGTAAPLSSEVACHGF